jgi:hypothetical protein
MICTIKGYELTFAENTIFSTRLCKTLELVLGLRISLDIIYDVAIFKNLRMQKL